MPSLLLSLRSLFRGAYYYLVSCFAAFYIVFVQSCVRVARRGVARVQGLLGRRSQKVGSTLRPTRPSSGLGFYRHARDGAYPLPAAARWSLSQCPAREGSVPTTDGSGLLRYRILFPDNPRLMVLANGLGLHAVDVFAAIVHRYGRRGGDWSFVTWEYRGLFGSAEEESNKDAPPPRRLAIPHHAEDLRAILLAESRRADVIVGFSMGVQIALEFAALYPREVDRLVLLNGTYGNVFSSAFQPICRVPFVSTLVNAGIELLLARPALFACLLRGARPFLRAAARVYKWLLHDELLADLLGEEYVRTLIDTYELNLLSNPSHTANVLRLFQELDAHSVYHLLPAVKQPTLIISGLLDILTPAYLSFELRRRLPNSRHVVAHLAAHCVLFERPRVVLREMKAFLEEETAFSATSSILHASSKRVPSAVSTLTHQSHAADTTANSSASESSSSSADGACCSTVAAFDRAALVSAVVADSIELPPTAEDVPAAAAAATAIAQKEVTLAADETSIVAAASSSDAVAVAAVAAESNGTSAGVAPAAAAAAAVAVDADLTVTELAHLLPGQRPIAVLTCVEQDSRKRDDRALLAHLRSAGLPCEHVIWHSPPRAWHEYAAIVVRSPWGYFKRPEEWKRMLDDIEAAGVPIANPSAMLRWNARKTYLRRMEETRRQKDLNDKKKVASSSSSVSFDFIPTVWLRQSELTASFVSAAMLDDAALWTHGSVLKPTSSAGGFATVRIPALNGTAADNYAALEDAVKQAATQGLTTTDDAVTTTATATTTDDDKDDATWMLQPFQPQIVTDGEYSFFFMRDGREDETGADSAVVDGLRFVHAGNKRPRVGSFLVQPTNGGILVPYTPLEGEVAAARDMLASTPFSPSDFLYVRVDCIRAASTENSSRPSTDKFLLMEIEAIEPDYYSHLTPSFDRLYFNTVRAFLKRVGAWPTETDTEPTKESTEAATVVAEVASVNGAAAENGTAAAADPSSSCSDSYESRAHHVERLRDEFVAASAEVIEEITTTTPDPVDVEDATPTAAVGGSTNDGNKKKKKKKNKKKA